MRACVCWGRYVLCASGKNETWLGGGCSVVANDGDRLGKELHADGLEGGRDLLCIGRSIGHAGGTGRFEKRLVKTRLAVPLHATGCDGH